MDDDFKSKFTAASSHLDQTLKTDVFSACDQYLEATSYVRGNTKTAIMSQSSINKKENLADAVVSLQEVCGSLFNIVLKLSSVSSTSLSHDIALKCAEKFQQLIAPSVSKINHPINNELAPDALQSKPESIKHAVIVENAIGDDVEAFDESSWKEVVKHSMAKKLKSIPVEKTVLTKSGKGCIILPDKNTQDKALDLLRSETDIKVTANSKPKRTVLPKMKILNINPEYLSSKENLKAAICEKNPDIDQLHQKGNTFEVILITSSFNSKNAIIKVSPDIRNQIMKKGKLYIGMEALHVRDHFMPLQCFSCQEYGHAAGSPDCKNTATTQSTCLYCAGPHKSKECSVKKEKDKHKCANCFHSDVTKYRENAFHTSNSLSCPFVIKETNALILRTTGLNKDDTKKYLMAN